MKKLINNLYGFQLSMTILHIQKEFDFMERLFYDARKEDCAELAKEWNRKLEKFQVSPEVLKKTTDY